jgi:phosphatidylglycerol:prolipoprotein diacylglycerol transferase
MEVERIHDTTEIYFPKLGWKFFINPTAFKIGGFEIQWYGILITLGLIAALVYCFPRMKRFGLDSDRAVDAVIGGVLGGIVGARLYYVLFNLDDYAKGSAKETIKAIVNTREGGLAIYGGLIGATVIGLLICKLRKVKMLPMLDVTVLGFLIGQGIGRWGNFVNQEAFGSNTSSFLGMTGGKIQDTIYYNTTFLDGTMDSSVDYLKTVHPCFLYESLWCILGFFVLSWFSKRRKFDGQILLMYLSWYGLERFFVEGLRTDSLYFGKIRISQALSAVLFVVSVILLIILFSKYRRDPEAFELYVNTEESHKLIEEGRRKRMGLPVEDIYSASADEEDIIDDFDDEDFDDDFDDDDDIADKAEKTAEKIKDDAEEKVSEAADKAEEKLEIAEETVKEKAEAVKDTAKEKVSEAADKAEEKLEKAEKNVREKAEAVKDAAEEKAPEAADSIEDKYEELAEKVDTKLSGGSGKKSHNKKKRNRK